MKEWSKPGKGMRGARSWGGILADPAVVGQDEDPKRIVNLYQQRPDHPYRACSAKACKQTSSQIIRTFRDPWYGLCVE